MGNMRMDSQSEINNQKSKILAYNRAAWDHQVEEQNEWTVPVNPEVIAAARRGEWEVVLTATKTVPKSWFPPMTGLDVLCLASGGGQQGPTFAAAGANVTVLDNSPRQLERDRQVAEREGLSIRTVQGDMADLSALAGESFDLIFHPVSNVFAPELRPVWREAFRVLRHGGILLVGMMNPDIYIFDRDLAEIGQLMVKYRLPYSDVNDLTEEEKAAYAEKGWPLEFSHTLDEQIGGQLGSGFILTSLYEDRFSGPNATVIDEHMPSFFATRAVKP